MDDLLVKDSFMERRLAFFLELTHTMLLAHQHLLVRLHETLMNETLRCTSPLILASHWEPRFGLW